jgi:hypothetical protein
MASQLLPLNCEHSITSGIILINLRPGNVIFEHPLLIDDWHLKIDYSL